MFVLPVDGVHGEDGVLADVGVTVFEARAAGWDEWLQKLRIFRYLLQEAEGCTANILIGMLL